MRAELQDMCALTERHQVITSLITPDSKHHLAATPLQLARLFGLQPWQAQVTLKGCGFILRFGYGPREASWNYEKTVLRKAG
jgi:hypothetical protein